MSCDQTQTTKPTYFCNAAIVWGFGGTPDEAYRQAKRYHSAGDQSVLWPIFELDPRVEWFCYLGVSFHWPDDCPPPRLVEVRDGRGRRLTMMGIPNLYLGGDLT
jgi:hypothetical protein